MNKNCVYLRYSLLMWYMYTLWNNYHSQAIKLSITSQIPYSCSCFLFLFLWWELLRSPLLASFKYTIHFLTVITCCTLSDLYNLVIFHYWNFVHFAPHFPFPPLSSLWQPSFYSLFYEFGCFRFQSLPCFYIGSSCIWGHLFLQLRMTELLFLPNWAQLSPS